MKGVLLVTMMVIYGCNRGGDEVVRPIVQNITESVYASGIVTSKDQYEVFSSVNGVVEQKMAHEGDTVRKGDIIMTLVNEVPRLRIKNARIAAMYSSASYNADRLKQLRINIDMARAARQNDSALFHRQQNLWKEGIGTRNELEKRELAWKNSVDAHDAAILQYLNLQKEINFSARQSVKNLDISNSLNNDYTIRALKNGKIYRILKEPCEMVNTQTPVAIIGDVDHFVIKLQVDEYDIGVIKPGQKVFLSMDSYRGKVFEAEIKRIEPIMNDRSRSIEVEAEFISGPPGLWLRRRSPQKEKPTVARGYSGRSRDDDPEASGSNQRPSRQSGMRYHCLWMFMENEKGS